MRSIRLVGISGSPRVGATDYAVKKALNQGKITIKRYDNYKKLIAEFKIPMSF